MVFYHRYKCRIIFQCWLHNTIIYYDFSVANWIHFTDPRKNSRKLNASLDFSKIKKITIVNGRFILFVRRSNVCLASWRPSDETWNRKCRTCWDTCTCPSGTRCCGRTTLTFRRPPKKHCSVWSNWGRRNGRYRPRPPTTMPQKQTFKQPRNVPHNTIRDVFSFLPSFPKNKPSEEGAIIYLISTLVFLSGRL